MDGKYVLAFAVILLLFAFARWAMRRHDSQQEAESPQCPTAEPEGAFAFNLDPHNRVVREVAARYDGLTYRYRRSGTDTHDQYEAPDSRRD